MSTKGPDGGWPASTLHVFNTLSRRSEVFEPATPGRVNMYVCGMTVYDYCHIGHARMMITFDVVYRWLVARGYDVVYVRNHTDVDDKIINRALERGEDPLALSARFIEALVEDLARLGLSSPTHEPKVSEHIPEIVALVERLVERGHAYAVDGDVYYAVDSFEGYGKLSGRRLDDLRVGERVDVDPRKRNPADFALWKAARPGEVAWKSPWGPGRPGWHVECSAMSMHYLGESFDIHGGGIDLVFPHHENEIAQSEGGTGHEPFARYWMHNGHLTMGAEKMSKSLGNFVRIRDILDEVPAEALRVLYLEGHYRSPLPYSTDRLTEALVALDRLYHAKEVLQEMAMQAPAGTVDDLERDIGETARDVAEQSDTFADRFAEAMDDDFNSTRALGLLYELARTINRFGNNKKWRKRGRALADGALDAFTLSGEVLGIGGLQPTEWFQQVRERRLRAIGHTEEEIQVKVDARLAARQEKDWAAADALRDELDALGVVLMDGPGGTAWRMRVE